MFRIPTVDLAITSFSTNSTWLFDTIIDCCNKLGNPTPTLTLGEIIRNLLCISGHAGQFDSFFALQNMQAGHPFVT